MTWKAKATSWIRDYKGPLMAAGAVIAIGLFFRGRRRLGPERYEIFNGMIAEAAQRYRVDVAFVRAVIRAESDFQPYIVSWAGAMGLMQLMPSTARGCGLGNAFDPRGNIRCGTALLRENLNRYDGNLELTLAAYNAGPRRAHNPPARTRRYIARVLNFYQRYRSA